MGANVYEIITDKIIAQLETGTIPWRRPWSAGSGMPRNFISKKEYRGINVFMLGCQQYSSPYWLTYRQAVEKNGNVRKGEKSSMVVFWKLNPTQEPDVTDTEAVTSVTPVTSEKQPRPNAPLLRYYNVFNLDQCEGIPSPPSETPIYQFTPIEKAEQIISGYKNRPNIHYGGNRAFYRPAEDRVQMPHEYTFERPEDFYAVLMHELAHSSGAAHRLARKEVMDHHAFGSESYGSEELCAEFCSSFLCGVAGISNQTIDLAASYIDGWLSVLKKDKKMLVIAAARAQAAADYILGRKFGVEEEPA